MGPPAQDQVLRIGTVCHRVRRLLDDFEVAADLADAALAFEDLVAFVDAEGAEVVERGRHRVEAVGFLADEDQADAHQMTRTASRTASSVRSITASSCSVERNQAPRSSARTPRSSRAVVKRI